MQIFKKKQHQQKVHRPKKKWSSSRLQYLGIGVFIMMLLLLPILKNIFFPSQSQAAWFNSSWTYRKTLTIDNTKVFGPSNFTDFVVLVNITDSGLSSSAQSDGDDILFTSSDGSTQLDHDLVSYNSGTGEIVAWVKVPSLLTASDTVLYMYYGNAGASAQEDLTNTWDSSYSAVWHLEEASGSRTDSSGNSNTLTDNNTVLSGTGQIGTGADFEEATSEYLSIVDGSQTGLDLSANYTIQMWVKLEASSARDLGLLSKQSSANGVDRYEAYWGFESGAETFNMQHRVNSPSSTVLAISDFEEGTDVNAGTWYFLTITYSDSANEIVWCLNEICDSADSATNTLADNNGPFFLGQSVNQGTFMDGVLDEVRIQTSTRTSDWIVTQYNNESSPSTFLSVGTQETESAPPAESSSAPVLNWKFDDPYGTTAEDASPNNLDGTLTGSTTTEWQKPDLCASGSCVFLDGTGDYITRADNATLDFANADSFTLEGWFRHTVKTSGTEVMIAKYSATAGYQIRMLSDGDIECGVDDDASYTPDDAVTSTAATYDDNTWHHVACVKTGTTSLRLYIDGKEVGTPITTFASSGTYANGDAFLVGGAGTGTTNPWTGFIDDVRVYNTARTASQVKSDAIRGSSEEGASAFFGGNTSYLNDGLIGYWPLDITSGTAPDSSGNVLTLTNNGTTTGIGGKYGYAPFFNGSSKYFSTATSIPGVKTVSFWSRPTSTTDNYIMLATGVYINSSSGTLSATGFTNPTIFVNGDISSTVTANVWQHITITSETAVTANQFEVGRANGSYGANNSQIDDVRVFNRTLEPREVSLLSEWMAPPAGHWKFDDGSGNTTTVDSSGNGNTITLVNTNTSTDWMTGKYGSAISGDGVNNIAYINGSHATLETPYLTASAWVYARNTATCTTGGSCPMVITDCPRGCFSPGAGYWLDLIGGTTRGCIGDATGFHWATGATTVSLNTWHHVAFTYDGTNIRVYLDGVLDGTTASTKTILYTSAGAGGPLVKAFYAGNVHDNTASSNVTTANIRHFNGLIDEAKIYNYPLSAKQIVSDMNGGHPAGGSPIGSQIVYWKLDEASGNTLNNSVPTQAINGTNSGAAWLSPSSCKYNNCLNFDTTTDTVSAGDTAFTDSLTGFTSSIWLNPQTLATTKMIVSKANTATQRSFAIQTDSSSSDEIRVYVASGTTDTSNYFLTSDLNLTASTWQHLTVVYDGTQIAANRVKVYKNGNQVSGSVTGTIPTSLTTGSTSALKLGQGDDATPTALISYMDDFQFYNAPLTQAEVQVVLNANATSNFSTGILESNQLIDLSGTSPVGYWKFDDNTGTSSIDSSGNAYSMTLTNGPTWGQGKVGQAVEFDGSDDYATNATTTILDTSGAYTVMAWIYPQTYGEGNTGEIMGKASSWHFALNQTGTNFGIGYDANGSTCSSTAGSIVLNTWQHVTIVHDGAGVCTLYRNGLNVSSDTSVTDVNASAAFYIGAEDNATSFTFDGLIDEAKVYNYARTPSQVMYDYNRGGPIGWWKFDECTGTVINDSSGYGHTGTLTVGAVPYDAAGTCSSGNTNEAWNAGTIGKYGASIGLDGGTDSVSVTNSTDFDFSTGYSITGWIKIDTLANSSQHYLLSRYNFGSQTGYGLYVVNNGKVGCDFRGSTGRFETTASYISEDTWYHLACVWNGTRLLAFVNGNVVQSVNRASLTNTNTTLYLGRAADSSSSLYHLSGQLDDVRLYNYAISTKSAQIIMNEGAAARYGN